MVSVGTVHFFTFDSIDIDIIYDTYIDIDVDIYKLSHPTDTWYDSLDYKKNLGRLR